MAILLAIPLRRARGEVRVDHQRQRAHAAEVVDDRRHGVVRHAVEAVHAELLLDLARDDRLGPKSLDDEAERPARPARTRTPARPGIHRRHGRRAPRADRTWTSPPPRRCACRHRAPRSRPPRSCRQIPCAPPMARSRRRAYRPGWRLPRSVSMQVCPVCAPRWPRESTTSSETESKPSCAPSTAGGCGVWAPTMRCRLADDGLWAAGDPPPRAGCAMDVLIDGAEAFPAIADAIEGARDFIHVTGWHVAPHFDLVRGERPGTLGPMLAEAAERLDVRVLVWAGAPVPAFRPTRSQVRDGVEMLDPPHADPLRDRPARASVPLPSREDRGRRRRARIRRRHRHHRLRRRPLRHQRPSRPGASLGWHDVGSRLRGPAVLDVHDHFAMRWREVTGEHLARPDSSARRRPPHGPDRSHGLRGDVRRGAQGRVPASSRATCARCGRPSASSIWRTSSCGRRRSSASSPTSSEIPPATTSGLVILLPRRANNGHDDTLGQLAELTAADDGAGRLPGGHDPLAQRRPRRSPVRARQGRDRRRPLAHDRLGQPQRPLAAQRHRDERRHRRLGSRSRDAAAAVGRAPRGRRRVDRRR